MLSQASWRTAARQCPGQAGAQATGHQPRLACPQAVTVDLWTKAVAIALERTLISSNGSQAIR